MKVQKSIKSKLLILKHYENKLIKIIAKIIFNRHILSTNKLILQTIISKVAIIILQSFRLINPIFKFLIIVQIDPNQKQQKIIIQKIKVFITIIKTMKYKTLAIQINKYIKNFALLLPHNANY